MAGQVDIEPMASEDADDMLETIDTNIWWLTAAGGLASASDAQVVMVLPSVAKFVAALKERMLLVKTT